MILARYLCKDLFVRIASAPVKTVTKVFLAGILAGLAGVILLSFYVTYLDVGQRLERIGIRTILLQEHLDAGQRRKDVGPLHDHVRHWQAHGRAFFLERVGLRARTEVGSRPVLLSFRGEDVRGDFLSTTDAPLVYFDADLEPGLQVVVRIQDLPFVAATKAVPEWLGKLTTGPVLLGQESFFTAWPNRGRGTFFCVYEHAAANPTVAALSEELDALKQVEARDGATIYDASRLLREQETLDRQRGLWRFILLAAFGTAVSLVLTSIAIFEFREIRAIVALLRSFGVWSGWVVAESVAENLILMGMGLGGAAWILALVWRPICRSLGFGVRLLEAVDYATFLRADGIFVLLFVLVGVVAGSLPFIVGVRREIGRVLE